MRPGTSANRLNSRHRQPPGLPSPGMRCASGTFGPVAVHRAPPNLSATSISPVIWSNAWTASGGGDARRRGYYGFQLGHSTSTAAPIAARRAPPRPPGQQPSQCERHPSAAESRSLSARPCSASSILHARVLKGAQSYEPPLRWGAPVHRPPPSLPGRSTAGPGLRRAAGARYGGC